MPAESCHNPKNVRDCVRTIFRECHKGGSDEGGNIFPGFSFIQADLLLWYGVVILFFEPCWKLSAEGGGGGMGGGDFMCVYMVFPQLSDV